MVHKNTEKRAAMQNKFIFLAIKKKYLKHSSRVKYEKYRLQHYKFEVQVNSHNVV